MARVLITAMGGQLTAASTPGEGATFRIEPPAVARPIRFLSS